MTLPRKGRAYVPELSILLRDAAPLTSELEGSDLALVKEAGRRRDIARDILFGRYRDAAAAGTLDQLNAGVRSLCEEMKRSNAGHLPKRKGGRPGDQDFRLTVWLRAHDAIKGGSGAVKALREVAASLSPPRTYEHVRDIWYDRTAAWTRLTTATLAERQAAMDGELGPASGNG